MILLAYTNNSVANKRRPRTRTPNNTSNFLFIKKII